MTELVVQHDPVYWIAMDTDGQDVEAWVTAKAEERFPLEGRDPEPGELEVMAAALLNTMEQQALRETDSMPFAYTPLAALPRLLVDVMVLAGTDGSDAALRELTGAGDTDLLEPALVTTVETGLGTGLRSRRYYRQECSTAALGVITYGWHIAGEGVDIRLGTATEDLAVLQAAQEDLDLLARAPCLE